MEIVLSQLREQIAHLSRQVQKVETYRQFKEAYQALLSGWIAQELHSLEKLDRELEDQRAACEAALHQLKESLTLQEKEIHALEDRVATTEGELTEAAWEVLRQRYEALQREETKLTERLHHLDRQRAELQEELALRQRQRQELTTEEASLRERRQARETLYLQELDALRTEQKAFDELQQQLQEKDHSLREKENQRKAAEKNLYQLIKEADALEARREAHQARLAQLKQEEEALVAELQRLETDQKEATARHAELLCRYDRILGVYRALQAQKGALEAEREKVDGHLQRVEGSSQKLRSHRQVLEGLLLRAEGWPSFLTALRRQGLTFWRTEDLFFAEETDMPALSLLLRLEPPTLWVRSQEEADRLHTILLAQKEGFFSVRVYKGGTVLPSGGWADRLQVLAGFEGLAQHLWGDVQVGGEPREGNRWISPDGKWMRLPDGRVYALAPTPTAHIGLPHRIQRTLEKERQLDRIHAYLSDQKKEIEGLRRRLPLEAWGRILQETEKALKAHENELDRWSLRIEETSRRRQRLLQDKDRLEQELIRLMKEEEELREPIKALHAQVEDLQKAEAELREEIDQLRREREAHQVRLGELRLRAAQAENETKALDKAHKLTLQQLEEVRRRLQYLTDKRQEIEAGYAQAAAQLSRVASEKAELEPQLADLSRRAQQLRIEKKALEGELQSLRRAYKTQQEAYHAHQMQLAHIESKRAEIAQRKALLLQRLEVELELTPEALRLPSRRLRSEEVEKELARIKAEMAVLGELNFEAAALLNALRSREAELLREKADSEKTLHQLKHLLDSLDREACDRFLGAFGVVRERFIELFQGLFAEGDSCDLVLVDPEKPLSSEIEILARPKGKRPLSLQQLSGGEKALTVLALLFATFSVRPSALCVLDEVDAPLDDYNAHKFGQLLQRFSKQTPLLVITHNKITMSYCEALYGVTMPEPGVSVVLAAEMKEAAVSPSAA